MQTIDYISAEITWLGAYKKAISPKNKGGLGLSREEALTYANDTTVKTQASAQLHDLAPIQRSLEGRFLTTFQTFVINEWNFLSKDVFVLKIQEW